MKDDKPNKVPMCSFEKCYEVKLYLVIVAFFHDIFYSIVFEYMSDI